MRLKADRRSGVDLRHTMNQAPPDWIVEGAKADYHAAIGGPVTKAGCTVRTNPSRLGGPQGPWVVWLEEVSGCVAVAALTRAAAPC